MMGAPLALLWLGALASAPVATRLEVRVTEPAARGGAPDVDTDVEDAGLTGALAQALVDAGLPATRARVGAADAPCGDGCLRVLVQRTGAQRFVVDVRATGQSSRALVQLNASASAFDLAHALAIQVEVLADRTHAARRRTAHAARAVRAALASTDDAGPADATAPAGTPADSAPADQVVAPGAVAPARADATPPSRSPDEPPTVRTAPGAPGARDARLAIDVSALVLAAPDGDLFMHGATVGTRVRIGHAGQVRAAIALLRPQRRSLVNTPYQRELLPLELVISGEVPRVPALHVGVGLEAVLVSGEVAGRDGPSDWSLGAIGRIEYRYAIRSFALLAAVQAALHPPPWRTGREDQSPSPSPMADMPPWTMGAALGLEFTVF
jgi:hypothetical protein